MAQTVGPDRIAKLAAMEHGRWNIERLGYGWRYASVKDAAKRRSPYLIPWDDVPPDIQKFDVDAIVNLPKRMREAGLEVVEVPKDVRP